MNDRFQKIVVAFIIQQGLHWTRSFFNCTFHDHFSDMDLCYNLGLLLFFLKLPRTWAVLIKGEQKNTKKSISVYIKTDLVT